ncbi:MAG: error-prone DNA polymerase [Phycisphaerales bacterium]|nr:error-prone DNA polymerase [Phycisphaerales bacterium]
MTLRYVELAVTTNFTFLTGASHPDEMVARAAELSHAAVAIADCNTLAGIVRAHTAAKEVGIPLVVGSRVRVGTSDEGGKRRRDEETERRSERGPSGSEGLTGDAQVSQGSPPPARQPRPTPPQAGEEHLDILLFPTDRASYGRLCQLLTLGKRRAPKGECFLTLHDVLEHAEGTLGVVMPPRAMDERFVERVRALRAVFDDDRLSIAGRRVYAQDDAQHLKMTANLCDYVGVPMVATNYVHYHLPQRRMLHDVLTCIRHGCTIQRAGLRLASNAERHLKPAEEMARLFADEPRAIARTVEIAERTRGFSLDQLRYEYPDEVVPAGQTATTHLRTLTWEGAAWRYPGGVPEAVRAQIEHELALITELRYEPYFLTVHDLVQYAVSQGILCQGRGAAANSAVCYCLGVTSVDPTCVNLLFERFISRERDEPPDIDIDFEHERREEVIQYIYHKYGRHRAALTAEVISYRGRSAVRDVGKAMGLSLDLVDRMAKELDWWEQGPGDPERLHEIGLDAQDRHIAQVLALSQELMGFPRHLSQHVGGFVITRGALCELVPIENAAMEDRTVIEWDKDDIDALGMLKVDCLGLGMLTCVGRGLELLGRHLGTRHDLFASIARSPTDADVYDMICRADTVGVFQIESRAQMSMLPRLRPRCYYDLVIEVAIVRPGPIQGKMVHPYLRRRSGEEPVVFASADIERVLGRTLGVPLFQEQAMALAVVAAGFTPGEADQLRRAMAAWKRSGRAILKFERKLIEGMIARGYDRRFAEQVFQQITGFSGYGFPESHAASFAIIVYVSAWLKRHHPAAFACALINSQPMGFYQPAQIVRDAREHGVEVRGVDANRSEWDCRLEESDEATGRRSDEGGKRRIGEETEDQGSAIGQATSASIDPGGSRLGADVLRPVARSDPSTWGHGGPALRLGMRLVKGLVREEAERVVEGVRRFGPFRSLEEMRLRTGVRASTLVKLADADAFGSMGLSRQRALWEAHALRDAPAPLFEQPRDESGEQPTEPGSEVDPALPEVPLQVEVAEDYLSVGLSLKAHPVSFIRDRLKAAGVTQNCDLADERLCPHGRVVTVAGVVLVRQRPGTASGVVFVTIEDETGIANLILRPEVYERFRRVAKHSRTLACRGAIERQGAVVHVLAGALRSLDAGATPIREMSRNFH